MKPNRSHILAVGVVLAMAFIFSCSQETKIVSNGQGNSLYCDYGPVNEWGGGCYEIEHEDDCDLEWGHIADSCPSDDPNTGGGNDVYCKDNYLGKGYDVISSGYINRGSVKIAHNILDQNKLCQDGLIVTDDLAREQLFETATGSTIKEFYENRNSSINLGLGREVTNLFFSGNFRTEFSIGASDAVVQKAFYSRMRSYTLYTR
jgi:hypothetical protein